MLAVCLARQAAEHGYRVYYTSAADLAARCHRAALEGRWHPAMRFYSGPGLLVIDELGRELGAARSLSEAEGGSSSDNWDGLPPAGRARMGCRGARSP